MGAWTRPNVRQNVKELVGQRQQASRCSSAWRTDVRNIRHKAKELNVSLQQAVTTEETRKKQRVSTKEEAASGEAHTRE